MPPFDLVRDCARCAALCCVAHPFSSSEDFAFDKDADERCRHLTADDRCSVHRTLVERGMRGCALYDCHGAGQHVTARLGGDPALRSPELLEAFRVMRTLHEWMALLTTARSHRASAPLSTDIAAVLVALEAAASAPTRDLLEADLRPLRRAVDDLLRRLRPRFAKGGGLPIVDP
jgi:hypothetical protein